MQHTEGAAPARRGPRSKAALIALAIVAALLFAGFTALGTWQVQRRAWKLDLIERVTQRVNAPAQAAPGQGEWPRINAAEHEYRHVRLTGTFLHKDESLVQASTVRGGGFWVLTPLRLDDGSVVLVNRGFVPPELKDPAARATCNPGPVTVSGLLRLSEPGGGFLRHNDPAAGRWFSRDVQAIAQAHGLTNAAPYFVDADAASSPGGDSARAPEGGLTVLAFSNSHLVYAITWYTLALMVVGAAWYVVRVERRDARMQDNAGHADSDARSADAPR
ncbi:MAG TPA: SURF1 family protein [Candidatus Aquabacterium excrementipullorum]|nr:SURF1 family protein [Candidatus Aquabacterium excrementipullorum]